MSVFKSAMGYFSSGGANGGSDNDFVGQFVEIGNMKLRVKKVIAEGGFAFVYVAQDVASGTEYALKRLMAADEQANKNIIQEISILKKLSGHPNIIKYIAASFIDKSKTLHGMGEYLLLTDLCSGGSLMEALQNRGQAFPLSTIVRVFYQTCRAVQHMHAQVPPIAHRDLKLENFLISNEGTIKLCDFGSATTDVHTPNPSWSANQRNMLEETLAQFTTPMYRAPEMLDTWDNRKIDHAVDVWALGCILYTLCYMQHPFEDSAKLAILNGNYNLNPNDQRFKCFHQIISGCLCVNPGSRLPVAGILERLAAIAESNSVNLKQPLKFERKKVEQSVATSSPGPPGAAPAAGAGEQADSRAPPPARPPAPAPAPAPAHHASHHHQPSMGSAGGGGGGGGGLFSSLKGGAGSFLKNLKDTSSKVMQTVQQSIARTDLDISYITSRLVVMPFPSEGLESAYKTNHIDDVKAYLESRHPSGKYCVINATRARAHFPRHVHVTDTRALWPTAEHRAPLLAPYYALLQRMYQALGDERTQRAVVVTCPDGKQYSGVLVCGLLLYAKLVDTPDAAWRVWRCRRAPAPAPAAPAAPCPPGAAPGAPLPPAHRRYLNYLSNIVRHSPILPHFRPASLVSITIQPVPLFTKARDGCRPYIEIYNEERMLLSTQQEYERLHLYSAHEGKVTLPLDTTVCGDVMVAVYHARQQLGRVHAVRVLSVSFHTGFLRPDQHHASFNRSEIDGIDETVPVNDHFSANTSVVISLVVQGTERRKPGSDVWEEDHSYPIRTPDVLFSNKLERDETLDSFAAANISPKEEKVPPSRPAPHRPPPPAPAAAPAPAPAPAPAAAAEADFLNISNQGRPPPQQQQQDRGNKLKNEDSFDFFGLMEKKDDFGDFLSGQAVADNPQPFTSEPIFSDLPPPPPPAPAPGAGVGGAPAGDVTSSADAMSFDPFGLNEPLPKQEPLLTPQSLVDNGRPSSVSLEQAQPSKKDPFADLNVLGAPLPPRAPATPSPLHGARAVPPAGVEGGAPGGTPAATPAPSPAHLPRTPARSPQHQPDYNRAHFEPPKGAAGTAGTAGAEAKKPGDVFGELLGSQGYAFGKRDAGPRTMNAMRKEELKTEMDPEKFKIHEWTEGKKANIRALLCSLHTVAWEECRWTACDMSQLVSASDVKRQYRRACLALHPDKQMGTPNENLAKLIFMELNNAWSEFEQDATQQNLFQS